MEDLDLRGGQKARQKALPVGLWRGFSTRRRLACGAEAESRIG